MSNTTKGKHFNVKTTCENEKPNINASLEKYIFIKKKNIHIKSKQ